MASHAQAVRAHYDANTRRFLRHGQRAHTYNIHQPLWPPGVATLAEAVAVSNSMVAEQMLLLQERFRAPGFRVMDLGCGVGSTLLSLAGQAPDWAELTGITISPEQVAIGQRLAKAAGHEDRVNIALGDFTDLGERPRQHLLFSIEAFLHGPDPLAFFREAARMLVPGGRLLIIDDVLLATPPDRRGQQLLQDFREGWLAGSLLPLTEISTLSADQGLRMVTQRSLTPWMRLGRPRDQLIGWMRVFARERMQRSTYWRSLSGGYAKQQCLRQGWLSYHYLLFEKAEAEGGG